MNQFLHISNKVCSYFVKPLCLLGCIERMTDENVYCSRCMYYILYYILQTCFTLYFIKLHY